MLAPGRFASVAYELPHGTQHVLALLGEHDLTTTTLFRAYLDRPPPAVVDVSGVQLIDSSSLETLARAVARGRRHAPVVQLARGGPVRRLFELLGLAGTFRCADSRRAALELAVGPIPEALEGTIVCPCGARYRFVERGGTAVVLEPDGNAGRVVKRGRCEECSERLAPLLETSV
jgi:anti-anti-sigma regulatory factor